MLGPCRGCSGSCCGPAGGTDPLIVVGQAGKGRSMAFTSDLAPHWGTDFVKWSHYGAFCCQAIHWLAEK